MEYPNYYGIIPAQVRYAKIADRAKVLYAEITALANKWGYCTASNGYFAELYGCTAPAISQHITALATAGFIRCEYIETGNGAQVERHIFPVAMAANPLSIAKAPLKHSLTPPLAQLKHNNTSINTKEDIYTNENEKNENPDLIINASKYAKEAFCKFLQANSQYSEGYNNLHFAAAVDGHFNKLQRDGQTFELQVPADDGKFYQWFAKRLAGVKSWMQSAKNINEKNMRRVETSTSSAYVAPVEQSKPREKMVPVAMPFVNLGKNKVI